MVKGLETFMVMSKVKPFKVIECHRTFITKL